MRDTPGNLCLDLIPNRKCFKQPSLWGRDRVYEEIEKVVREGRDR